MTDKITVERVTCSCGHGWNSSHPEGTLMVECPKCERETLTLTDPDTITELEQATVKPKRGRTTSKGPLRDR